MIYARAIHYEPVTKHGMVRKIKDKLFIKIIVLQKKSLGRGLEALLNDINLEGTAMPSNSGDFVEFSSISMDCIHPNPHQPRRSFDEIKLQELALSIKEKGVLQPILVRPLTEKPTDFEKENSPTDLQDNFQIIAGERRFRASQIAGLTHIPCRVIHLNDQEVLEVALLENIQRDDLNVIEEAQGYEQLLKEFNYTQDQLAKVIGKSRSHITNTLRLLQLSPKIQDFVKEGLLSQGHVKILVGKENSDALAQKMIHDGMSVRESERLLQREKLKNSSTFQTQDPESKHLEENLHQLTGLLVDVHLKKKSASITFSFHTMDELDSFVERLEKSFS